MDDESQFRAAFKLSDFPRIYSPREAGHNLSSRRQANVFPEVGAADVPSEAHRAGSRAHVRVRHTMHGYFGCNSEYAPLRRVLVRRPGMEIDEIPDPEKVLFQSSLSPDLARKQHDDLALCLRSAGVEIEYVDACAATHPNLYFCRDLILVTAAGLVVCRPATQVRSGEERIAHESLRALGIPTAFQIQEPGRLEGGDVCLAAPDFAIIGVGGRTNLEGARQLTGFLRAEGFREIHTVELPNHVLHLDMVMAMLDRNLAAVCERDAPPALLEILARHGISTVSLPSDEAEQGMALNFLCVRPRYIIAPSSNKSSKQRLENAGVCCREVEVSELMKGGGAIHCMTAVIARDFVAAASEEIPNALSTTGSPCSRPQGCLP